MSEYAEILRGMFEAVVMGTGIVLILRRAERGSLRWLAPALLLAVGTYGYLTFHRPLGEVNSFEQSPIPSVLAPVVGAIVCIGLAVAGRIEKWPTLVAVLAGPVVFYFSDLFVRIALMFVL